jgi:serine/threonine protein kinase/tetratricopeptide (TPR) repeat protein
MIELPRPFEHALADRYEVERPLGRGGMATVYLAEDLKHHRKVAVKVLRPELAAALEADRFLREIDIAAKLNHPHILALYDSGAVDGLLFYVMPHISGESLRQKLERERQLSIDDALRITAQVASALDHAHARGLIHRDIKPENILLYEGEAMVSDFGIALAVSAAGTERLTQVGMALGTPEYMSPEQAAGDREVDARSDVYSLACVYYEMLAGEPPYTGTARALIVKHIVDPVPAVRRLRDAIPAGVDQALTRALAKAPADRFPSAGEFATALTKGSAGPPSLRSIAVLPFVNLSADADNEYFADGVTEDVITQLSKIRALKVVSRTSVMPFKKRDVSLRDIGAQLGVSTIVEGSVRRAGNRVRVVAQLIDAETDEHLWAETYDRDLNDIFAIQSDLALQIASALETVLTPDERARIEKVPTGGPAMSLSAAFITRALSLETKLDKTVQAYQNCLKGRFHWYKLTPEDLDKALEYYELSVEEDPEFAPAHVGIAQVWAGRAALGAVPPHEAMPKAKAAAKRALELDDTLGEAHDVLAWVLVWYDYDWPVAEMEFRRAIELNPGYAHSHLFCALFLNSMRRWEEAKALTERALELDPNNPFFKWIAGFQLVHRRRYDEGIAQIKESLPDFPTAHWGLWVAFDAMRRYDDALAEAKEWLSRAAAHVPEAGDVLVRGHEQGGYPAAMRAAAEALVAGSHQMYVDPHLIAELYACADDRDQALQWLERAYEERCIPMVYLAVHPPWDAIRDDPRFQSLVRRMKLPS